MIGEARKIIKNYINHLPYRDGTKTEILFIFKTVFKYSPFGLYWYLKCRTELYEANEIINMINNKMINEVLIIYDFKVSPPTYGDFLFVVMLARYFIKHNFKVIFYIVNLEYRSDWKSMDDVMKNKFTDDQVTISNLLLNKSKTKGLARIELGNWSELETLINNLNYEDILIPFKQRVLSRKSIYNSCFNVINYLIAQEDKAFSNKFLFSFDEFKTNVNIDYPDFPYITLHCRYSKKWRKDSNTSDKEFIIVANKLKSLFPNHAIMVVSDSIGCAYFKVLAKSNSINCLFSKDYSPSFLGDGSLILGSDYYFQQRAGGIGVFVYFSNIPCDYFTPMASENEWSDGKLTSWANDKQIIKKIDWNDKRIYLPTGLIKTENYQWIK